MESGNFYASALLLLTLLLSTRQCLCAAKPMGALVISILSVDRQFALITCGCAKCGSTSLLNMEYQFLLGKRPPEKLDIHHPELWGAPRGLRFERTFPFQPPLHVPAMRAVVVVRDPVDRYISAWHSKVKCCSLVPCYDDIGKRHGQSAKHVAALKKYMPHPPKRVCLTFDEYVDALASAAKSGKIGDIDIHFRPQYAVCRLPESLHPTYTVIKNASAILNTLAPTMGRFRVKDMRIHQTTNRNATKDLPLRSLQPICESIIRREYEYLDSIGVKFERKVVC